MAEPNQESADLASSLTTAFLVLLEQLAPTERAVFLTDSGCCPRSLATAIGEKLRVGVQHRHQVPDVAGDAGVSEAPHDLLRFTA